MSNRKKTFALLTVPPNEKVLEILTFNDAEIILGNKYSGKDFMEDASNYLLDLKNSKNLEGVILDFYCHENAEFLHEIGRYFSEFCENKFILFRLVYQNIIFTSMLLFHSDMDFNPDDTVYSIWIKKDMFVSYKLENSTLYFINEMKIDDNFMENEKYDNLFDCENPPKFLILGSLASDSRLKKLKNRFKASKTKVMHCTYEDCLKKSASHYLSRFIRAKDWRWNFKLSKSTNPMIQRNSVIRKQSEISKQINSNKAMIFLTMLAFIALAIAVAAIFSLTGVLDVEEADKQYFDEPIEHKEYVIHIDEKVFEYLKDLIFNGKNIPIDEKIIPDVKLRKRLTKIQTMYNEFQGNLQKIWDALNVLEGRITKNLSRRRISII